MLPEKYAIETSGAATSVERVMRVKCHDSGCCVELLIIHISNISMALGDFMAKSLGTCRLSLVITRKALNI